MKDSIIFKVPLFSVDEGDNLNKSSVQKTFQQAVNRMYSEAGMFLQYDREVHYMKTGRKIVKLDEVRFFVFGELFKISDAKLFFGAQHPYLINELERIEALGFDEVAYNSFVKKIIPFNDEQMVILSDNVAEVLAEDMQGRINGSKDWLFSEPLFKPLCLKQSDYEPVVLSELLNNISLNFDQYHGIEVFERIYYGDGSSEIKPKNTMYVFEDSIIGKNLLLSMFSDDKSRLRLINKSPGQQMVMDSEKRLLPLSDNAVILRRAVVRSWMK